MSGQARVFARQDPALVGHKLPEQVNTLKIERIDGEIDLGLRTWRPPFRGCAATTPFGVPFLRMGFARHKSYLISR